MPPALPSERRANRLAGEKSPYLLQHAHNPVDWFPWGDEAFSLARAENRPIFLSIGYSTCHWCHVMERESFENPAVAELLNRWFVPVKVDREERPDVDRIYMTAMQALGMGGGWPLNVFLTPALEPFFGGTYFPPDASFGRPGLLQVLPRVHEAWVERRDDLEDTGRRVLAALADLEKPDPPAAGAPPAVGAPLAQPAREAPALFELAFRWFERAADRGNGGFGTAPKFPSPCNLAFLTRWALGSNERRSETLRLVTAQLDAMRAGGIHDHLGGGFHRYSVDAEWLVSHFEKMLYDQAQLAWAYLEGFQMTGERAYADTARGIFTYVLRDLSSPEGGFFSAEDADSEGEEGRFYVWTPAQLEAALGADDAALVARRFGVTPQGNFEHGASVLHEARSIADLARERKLDEGELRTRLARAAALLLGERSRRPRPHLDDKVLASWNGLMISACARGARVLNEAALAERGTRAGEFVWTRMWNASARELHRRWRDGEAAMAGQLDDYANVALGFLDLYGATFEPEWLERAAEVAGAMIERFEDRGVSGAEGAGGFFESPPGDDSIRLRLKDGHDGAELAGNSVAAQVVQALGVLLDRAEWRETANRAFAYYSGRLADAPAMMPQMLVAMDLARAKPRQVVIAGEPRDPDARALIAEFDRRFLPHDLLVVTGTGKRRSRLEELLPFVKPLVAKQGRASAYVCVDHACRLPVQDAAAFAAQLDEVATVASKRSAS